MNCVYYDFPSGYNMAAIATIYDSDRNVAPHMHKYQEFVLMAKGSCVHKYKNFTVTLVPGDVLLIPPHCEHSFAIHRNVLIYNCHFYPEQVGGQLQNMVGGISMQTVASSNHQELKQQWESIYQRAQISDDDLVAQHHTHPSDLNEQGIIHLSASETAYVQSMLNMMVDEQKKTQEWTEYMNPAYLQIILVMIRRAQLQQISRMSRYSMGKKKMILNVLTQIDDHLADKISFDCIAENLHLSQSYFRAVFKDITGLSPIDYLNRSRIIKSLEYLQTDAINVSEAAAKVGIWDANYFSRLFKKIIGYSPRMFRSIRDEK